MLKLFKTSIAIVLSLVTFNFFITACGEDNNIEPIQPTIVQIVLKSSAD